jgi:hypothetical protein
MPVSHLYKKDDLTLKVFGSLTLLPLTTCLLLTKYGGDKNTPNSLTLREPMSSGGTGVCLYMGPRQTDEKLGKDTKPDQLMPDASRSQ